jgi:flagellin
MNGIDLGAAEYSTALGSSVNNVANAQTALTNINAAITKLSEDRATIGAYQARLSHTADQLTVNRENLIAASSRIKDVDMAEESTEYAKENILVQSGTAMLAQANVMPQSVLRLLQQ